MFTFCSHVSFMKSNYIWFYTDISRSSHSEQFSEIVLKILLKSLKNTVKDHNGRNGIWNLGSGGKSRFIFIEAKPYRWGRFARGGLKGWGHYEYCSDFLHYQFKNILNWKVIGNNRLKIKNRSVSGERMIHSLNGLSLATSKACNIRSRLCFFAVIVH